LFPEVKLFLRTETLKQESEAGNSHKYKAYTGPFTAEDHPVFKDSVPTAEKTQQYIIKKIT
jgi:hypothetical protein